MHTYEWLPSAAIIITESPFSLGMYYIFSIIEKTSQTCEIAYCFGIDYFCPSSIILFSILGGSSRLLIVECYNNCFPRHSNCCLFLFLLQWCQYLHFFIPPNDFVWSLLFFLCFGEESVISSFGPLEIFFLQQFK